jgi:hypothetical protein
MHISVRIRREWGAMENYRQMEIVKVKEGIFSEFYCVSYKILPSAL